MAVLLPAGARGAATAALCAIPVVWRQRELESLWLPLSGTKLAWGAQNKGAYRTRLKPLMGLSSLLARRLGHRCPEGCPRAARAAAPRGERQHMGPEQREVSWRPSQPGICTGGGGTTKAGRDRSQGRGRGGKGDFIEVEYICLADISWILLRLLRAAL